jgi:membrane associated rhomboid family serine protease
MPPLPAITQALLLINTAVFCLQYLLGRWLEQWFGLAPIGSGFMPWQLVTYAFLHGDVLHLFFNMFALWMFGGELEQLWGRKRFMLFLLASVVSAALLQLLVSFIPDLGGRMIGASGGVYGLLLAQALLFPTRVIMPMFPPIPMKMRTYVIIFGGLELFFGVSGTNAGVAHFAHLGGMIGAYLMMLYWRGQSPFGSLRGRR